MKLVGLTGGIGSGKTTVAKMFKKLGVPVYIADVEAKKLMVRSKIIRRKLIQLFGEKTYIDNNLNKPFIAKAIFNDKDLLQKMNAIVHPKVAKHFKRWLNKQHAPYVIKESAIIFENNTQDNFDFIITITASKENRINRLLLRENTTIKKIEAVMKNQWLDKEKIKLSNFVIKNNELENTRKQVHKIHEKILKSL